MIALIGIDGSGKTTQGRWLAQWLTEQGHDAQYFKNPAGRMMIDRFARALGRHNGPDLLGRSYFALELGIRWIMVGRALAWSWLTGRTAIMDRYTYCHYALIRARGRSGEPWARRVLGRFPQPELIFWLRVPPNEAQHRVTKRGYDHEDLEYLSAFEEGYRSLPEAPRFTEVSAVADPVAVQARLRELTKVSWKSSVPPVSTAP
ncbi:MAG: dTMP kinase [Angustibacter sp.]